MDGRKSITPINPLIIGDDNYKNSPQKLHLKTFVNIKYITNKNYLAYIYN